MVAVCEGSLLTYLSQVPDPRGRKGRRHSSSAMLTAVVCGLLCGARGYTGIVEWLHDLPVDVWHWMGYTRRPPKLDCFRDFLMKLDPEVLENALKEWIANDLQLQIDDEESTDIEAISIDGKTLCGTLRPLTRAVHLLSAFDQKTGCVLGQCRVDGKTNEHKTSLEFLKTLVLKGRVVVADAMFTHRDVCQEILDSGGDYFLPVKENQPTLLRDITVEFAAQPAVFSPLRPASTSC